MQEVEEEWLVEVGWHVRSAVRRQGYAAEAAAAVREAARGRGFERLIAIIRPDNVASQGVATKIGLTLEREVNKNGGPALIFGADLHPLDRSRERLGPGTLRVTVHHRWPWEWSTWARRCAGGLPALGRFRPPAGSCGA